MTYDNYLSFIAAEDVRMGIKLWI